MKEYRNPSTGLTFMFDEGDAPAHYEAVKPAEKKAAPAPKNKAVKPSIKDA